MTTRKNQNSILVLATLGVYLGLVLVGATPQILAQAAMTKQFNVKDEIEVKDDLDKKPDGEGNEFSAAIGTYLGGMSAFVEDLRKLHATGKFNPENGLFKNTATYSHACTPADKSKLSRSNFPVDKSLRPAISKSEWSARGLAFVGDCVSSNDFLFSAEIWSSDFKLEYDGSLLHYQVSIPYSSPERATYARDGFESALGIYTSDNEAVNVLHKLTSFTTANNQVQIITRLPRAGLDPLLAANAE